MPMKFRWIPRRPRRVGAQPVADDEQNRPVVPVIESYLSWCEQCAAVQSAYERWSSGREERGLAFAIYRAELEFEEHAARAYRQSAERLTTTPRVEAPFTC
jgi:hypothetical protein